jgi:hypothetical protein
VAEKPKIFLFVNSSAPEWYVGLALAEDGHCLAQHVSSHPEWSKHDLGLTSDWKHEYYREHYPQGYELVWIDDPALGKDAGLDLAYERNQALAREADAKTEASHAG